MSRPRLQKGYLYKKSGSWMGRWRVYTSEGKSKQTAVALGSVGEMTRKQAQDQLLTYIKHDALQSGALNRIGSRAMICPRSSTRLKGGVHMMPSSRGAISELMVAVDLTTKGYSVYQPVDRCAACDLLALASDWTVLRVEVKTARMEKGQVRCELGRQIGCFDLIAFVFADGQIEYRKPSEITNLRFPLRVSVAKPADDSLHSASTSDAANVETAGGSEI